MCADVYDIAYMYALQQLGMYMSIFVSICACYLSMYEWSVYIRMYICIGMYLNYFI